jgi:hypothetical protein
VEIGLGWEILKRLEGLLRENRAENEVILSALSLAGTAYGGLRPDVGDDPEPAAFDAEADRWRVEAERTFVVAAVLSREVRGVEGNPRSDVNVRALTLLGDADPRVSPLLVKALERHDGDLDGDVCGDAYATLARLCRADAFAWIVETGATTDRRPDRVARTLAALLALRRFERIDGATRLDAVKRLTRRFASLEQATDAAGRAVWEEIEYETTETLRHLATDPATGVGPSHEGAPVCTIGQFTQWLRVHDDPRHPPWRPAEGGGK